MRLHLYDVILEPVITEKSTAQREQGKYTFKVHPKSNKNSVKETVEKIYNVHVQKITTRLMPGKWKRVRFRPGMTAEWKKATVTLKQGEKIELT